MSKKEWIILDTSSNIPNVKQNVVRVEMPEQEKARMVGFRYEGKKSRAKEVNLSHKCAIDFRKIEEDVNKKAEKLFKESRLMSLR